MEFLKNIFDECGLTVQHYERVHGGDINDAYCLFTSSGKLFLKLNDQKRFPAMFEREASGLNFLRKYSTLKIPEVVNTGVYNSRQYLLLEWLEKGSPAINFWEGFGSALATIHKTPQAYFGFYEDNYIGSLNQINDRHNKWSSFYSGCRIMPLVKRLFDEEYYSSTDVSNANSFCDQLEHIFPPEPPALLHGDLWSGNYLVTSSGAAAIFDPAVYFGHREMDIGMTMLFGGFDDRFYRSYNEVYPLEKDWRKRLQLTQLYPLLVHAVLFGGHYIAATKNILSAF